MSTGLVQVFRLPDLGEGLTEAGLVQWLVKVGDTITTDQAIAEVETAKSVVELPSPFAGVVVALHGEPGETIDVGAPVLEVSDGTAADAGTDAGDGTDAGSDPDIGQMQDSRTIAPAASDIRASVRESDAGETPEHEAYRAEERAGSGNVLIGYGTSASRTTGRRRRPAAAPAPASGPASASDPAPASASGPASGSADLGRTAVSRTFRAESSEIDAVVRDQDAARGTGRPVAVRSPLVRRLARDLGLDVHAITATGADGAVTRADVLRAAVDHAVDGVGAASSAPLLRTTTAASATAASASASAASATGSAEAAEIDGLPVRNRTRMSPLRKAANATLSRSRAEIPEATVWVDVDATALWDARREMAPEGGRAPSITALLARFVLLALAEHPLLASRLTPDATEVIEFDGVNLGIAADTPRGLMVPVVPHAEALTVSGLDAALRELAETARAGAMPPERLRGSTFTLNNYGGFGVDGSAAIINHPDVAILGIGRILERPWVVDGAIVPRRIVQLSLVFDHRVCDGGYAASFLRRVTELIEHPLRAFGGL